MNKKLVKGLKPGDHAACLQQGFSLLANLYKMENSMK